MNAEVLELCHNSGCSLFTALYGINEALPAEKKHYETSSLIQLYNEQLERLAENEDADLDRQIEAQLAEHLTKKIEKIVQLFKPETFKKDVLSKVDIKRATMEVEEQTGGLVNLMATRVQGKLYEDKYSIEQFLISGKKDFEQ